MQITLNNSIYKTNSISSYNTQYITNINSNANKKNIDNLSFQKNVVVTKTITSQLEHEKTKLLSQFKEILSKNIPILSQEERLHALIDRAHSIYRMKQKKEEELGEEARILETVVGLNPQQRLDRINQIRKEYNRLQKIRITEIELPAPSKDNYDYALINKFKNAVLNNEFNFEEIYIEHYKPLENITTVKEFKEKYPSIRVPKDPKEVIAQKITDTLDQEFYENLDALFLDGNTETITNFLLRYLSDYFEKLAPEIGINKGKLLEMLGIITTQAILNRYTEIVDSNSYDVIPKATRFMPIITDNDKKLLDIDYDAFVLTTLKKHYLEGLKPNQIEYVEGDKKIKISDIKSGDYVFEKMPDKIKLFFKFGTKADIIQRNYQMYIPEELKSRLDYFTGLDFANNDAIFEIIMDFYNCKFTQEDKQYLIKFLQILDKIKNNEISLEEAISELHSKNIRPHGTDKIAENEFRELEKKLRFEQQEKQRLVQLKQDFNDVINKLYEINLITVAENFSKYYPENLEEESVKNAQKIIDIINTILSNNKNINEAKNKILYWQFYNDYQKEKQNSNIYEKALEYSKNFEEKELRIGQYLLNREIIDNYPESRNLVEKPALLDKIIEKTNDDKDAATILLSKYNNYSVLETDKKQSIIEILKIFNPKDNNDKVILKHIIEKDYVNCNTTYKKQNGNKIFEATITSNAKKNILGKYNTLKSIELFESFEYAIKNFASSQKDAGIKKTGTNNDALEYKMELKIKGYPDRLFSSKNNYVFDIYSEKGLH